MTALTQPFISAIDGKQIESAALLGRSTDGVFNYSSFHGDRTLLDGTKKPLDKDDLMFLASATKIVTTIAALQCVERGQLSLKGDLKDVAPELAKLGILTGFDDDGQPIIKANEKSITLE
jgi:CubicO group peptidase (beta-lactamase class C family)